MTATEEMRDLLATIDWGYGLNRRELVGRLHQAGVVLSDKTVQALPVDRLYHNPAEVLGAVPESVWKQEVMWRRGGLSEQAESPRGHTENPSARERTRERDLDLPED
ncbi:MAG: hypothetical protein M0Z94_05310 [Dehalococcoidales bacterium]|nr:hypothetical protein [Dehalococcoidales bacterium]